MGLDLFKRAEAFSNREALVSEGRSYTYANLLQTASQIATSLLEGQNDLNEARVAFLVSPSFEYTAVQWGVWMAGGIAVPLCELHPLPSMQYVLDDTAASVLIAGPGFEKKLASLNRTKGTALLQWNELVKAVPGRLPDIHPRRRAMILYTSGTTSKPKGVVSTHQIIECQITTLVKAWCWEKTDYILNVLPLHHVHGIINVMSCALWSGACCEFLARFDSQRVWEIIKSGRLTLFMAVPTVYFKLIKYWADQPQKEQNILSIAASKMRLMVSGSAALPVSVMEKWEQISRHLLLERYGMTEIGMGLSNPYKGERKSGHVGLPLPGVQLRLVDESENEVPRGQQGEIQVKGPCVFMEYWNRPEATKDAFTPDGWFRTGDIAVWNEGSYKILGRDSVDIIKSGGYKISALEIEEALRKHRDVSDCAVVGLPDEEWGELVGALVVTKICKSAEQLQEYLKATIPGYKIPRIIHFTNELPRNVIGKVTKAEVKKILISS
ncbi:acyl-CoA synthetase [Lentiprolixibacter aurantiacus]|uniref:Acyl-CoA synthetase n=1 Tax=Lentiprolixibacter aurantiacus TaxID=2993939 RepID=A0AAE3SMP1_9FLAO|nr:acyl-CoA synthetase [Lentiprolixibacter aurantiacus]MCX2718501.1 acyl-CoA synthetase [Lentiprolixibacter aurantiacus]